MKYIGILATVIVVLSIGYFLTEPSLKDNNAIDVALPSHSPAATSPTQTNPHNHNSPSVKTNTPTTSTHTNIHSGKTGNPHFDQLSPEMQQALKDQLLLENPTETIDAKDGAIIIPAKGRFTQMPVAVQMPDGTIQIREYSNIPKPKMQLNK
ncbi:hypothetical protein NBRC116188_11880 [Oceaniserpentilla sp. 4NH20-0058]|uniref:hypothetical protein n=1 Tax=Oceaniserpentilla sp. 4NH20-0058 TaxID=3127660 RepID=UPI003109ED40